MTRRDVWVASCHGPPRGTASNYVANRAELLTQVVNRFYERLGPDESVLGKLAHSPRTLSTVIEPRCSGRSADAFANEEIP